MDAKIILALLVLSHIITDFVWQNNAIVEEKKASSKGMFKHIKHYLLINYILLLPYIELNNSLWWIIIVLSLTHWAIDKFKVNYDNERQDKGFESFLFDQISHFVLIGAFYPLIKGIPINHLTHTIGSIIIDYYPVFANLTQQNVFITIVILTGYIFNFKGATVITNKVLDKYLHLKDESKDLRKEFVKQVVEKYEFQKYDKAKENALVEIAITEKYESQNMNVTSEVVIKGEETKRNAGEAIGILERILILTLVLQNNYATIGLVLAGKALARYKKLEEKNFAEYFLIGTFTSIMVAFLTGIIIKTIINL